MTLPLIASVLILHFLAAMSDQSSFVAPTALTILKLAGAVSLVWLALIVWRHANAPRPTLDQGPAVPGIAGAIRLGFVTQTVNPKPAIFFGAIFMVCMPSDSHLAWYAALLFMILLNEPLWYVIVARVFSADVARNAYGRLKSRIDRVFVGMIPTFGLKIAIG